MLKAKFIKFKIGSIEALSIYHYDESIRKLIYQFKGCYDVELKNIFLFRYVTFLKIKYSGYIVIPIPSSKVDDEKRGFNHVKEMFSILKMNMIDELEKISQEKQSSLTSKNRLNINDKLILKNKDSITSKKILIVDDIYTTGATMFKAIELIKKAKPKDIKVLTIAKTIDLDKRQKK
ncbi:MAG: ComF family protein [Bacilli bacterium]|nr:ComF family protein [Bacilli bacterium]